MLPDGFAYLPGVFDPAAAAAHLDGLLAEVPWERHEFSIYGRSVPMPRLIAMYGPVGYRYSGVEHPARPLTPRLEEICSRVEAAGRVRFNSVLVNLYRDGRDSVSWHKDSDYVHGGHPDIASVSFGATRRFQMRDATGQRAEIDLEAGSVLLISGAAVARWWHCVPKTARPVGPRVNLTFRHMVGTPPETVESGLGLVSLDVTEIQAAKRRSSRRKRATMAGTVPTSSVGTPCGATKRPARCRHSARRV
jgi:alkylated DNA repair dioxygenase AlkB